MMVAGTAAWFLRGVFISWPLVAAAVFSVLLLMGMFVSRSEPPVVEPPLEWIDLIQSGQPAPTGRVSLDAVRR